MIRWRFYEPNPARDLLDSMLQQMPRNWRGELGRGEPMPINVHSNENETLVEAHLPGVKPEDVEITGNDGILTIRAHSQIEEKDYHHQEIYSVEYQRQLSLPPDTRLDAARAEFEHGVLTVHLPKQQPKAPERVRIEVSGGQSKTPIEAQKGDGYSEVKGSAVNSTGNGKKSSGSSTARSTSRSSTSSKRTSSKQGQ